MLELSPSYPPIESRDVILCIMPAKHCAVYCLGKVPYAQAWKLQETLAEEIASGGRLPALLLLEHPHTYTFGRRGRQENLLWAEAELERRGISTFWVDRGGDITYHGPGQLVGYPLLPLAMGGLMPARPGEPPRLPYADYVGYIRRLEQALIDLLEKYGVQACQKEDLTGVWVETPTGPLKLASIGVKVDARGISRHGFALNVNPDMEYWNGIISCGLKEYAMTSLAGLLDTPPSLEQVMQDCIVSFGNVFGYEMVAGGEL
jgi:lipoyl(octanoyl) transferase